MSKSFSELKSDSLVTLDKVQTMLNNILKGTKTPEFDQNTISDDCWLNKLVSDMTTVVNNDSEQTYVSSEESYLKLISSIKQTVDGLNDLINATKDMANNNSPFVEIASAKTTEDPYTSDPPEIPFIELWGKCVNNGTEMDAYLETIDGVKSYKGNIGKFYLKISDSTKPSYTDYNNPSSNAKKTVSLCLKGVSVKDKDDNIIPLSQYSFLLDESSTTVEIKEYGSELYAQVIMYFKYPLVANNDFPANFITKKETLGFSSITTPVTELSFNLKVVDKRHNM